MGSYFSGLKEFLSLIINFPLNDSGTLLKKENFSFFPLIFPKLLDNILTCSFGGFYTCENIGKSQCLYLKQNSLAQFWKTEIEMRLLTLDFCWARSVTCFKHTSAQN